MDIQPEFNLAQRVMVIGDSKAPMGTIGRIAKIYDVDIGDSSIKVYDLHPEVVDQTGQHLLFQGKHLMALEPPRDMIYYYPNIKLGG